MAPKPNAGLILVVEEPSISRLVKSVLTAYGHAVRTVDAAEAKHTIDSAEPPVALLITNRPQEFGRFDGVVPMLYLTSTPDWALAGRCHNLRILRKPFRARDLVTAVEELTHSPAC